MGCGRASPRGDRRGLSHRRARPRPRWRPSPPATARLNRSTVRAIDERVVVRHGRQRAGEVTVGHQGAVHAIDERCHEARRPPRRRPSDRWRWPRRPRARTARPLTAPARHRARRSGRAPRPGRLRAATARRACPPGLRDLVALARVPAAEVEDATLRRPRCRTKTAQVDAGGITGRPPSSGGGRPCPQSSSSRSARSRDHARQPAEGARLRRQPRTSPRGSRRRAGRRAGAQR